MQIPIPRLIASLAISLLATACGGGGGGGGGAATNTPAPEPLPPLAPPAPALFTIAGTIAASSNQAVDSDTNDPARISISNDTAATAQSIPSPITLGGYINLPGTGAAGRSQQDGDSEDFYRVELLAGQSVTMLVADFEQADADLYLYDARGTIVDVSIDIGETETLLIRQNGTYFVNVSAYRGGTNYILAIGAANTVNGQAYSRYPIVPWQTVVKYRDNDSSVAPAHGDISRRLGIAQRAGGRGRGRLMALRRGLITTTQLEQRLGAAAAKLDSIASPELRARWETLLAIKALRQDPQVEYAEPNYALRALAQPDDEAYPFQWHYPLIGLPEAWDTTTGSAEVIVAVVDTGILPAHPDLVGQMVDGYDFVSDPASAGDGDGIDPNPRDPGNPLAAGSSSFHGTHVSGTVAARADNGVGVAGAAYTSRVMPLRALGGGGAGTSYDVNQAIRFAAGLPNDSGTVPQRAADIINLSLGGGLFSQASQDLYKQVRAAGVVMVAAAGNEASSLPAYPASYEGVISVSAVDAQRRLALYSNTGAHIDIAAPGGDNSVDLNGDGYPDGVLSTGGSATGSGINFVYSFLSGTSMAAPHVAAVLALMKSVNPALTPEDIDALLVGGALSDDAGAPGRDNQYGHGIINAQQAVLAALEAAGGSPAANPRLTASASTLNFAGNNDTLDLVLRNGGEGELELLQLTVSQAWLTITPLEADAAGLGTYRVAVDRSGLPTGTQAAEIFAQSSVNSLRIGVLVSTGAEDSVADVGVIYILLYEPESEETVAQVVSTAREGRYTFEFSGVPAGEYEIAAGSDADNDLFICDPGEACGAWLTVDQPIRIRLDKDMDNIDFPIEYLVSLPSTAGNSPPGTDTGAGRASRETAKGIAKLPAQTDD